MARGDLPMGERELVFRAFLRSQLQIVVIERLDDVPVSVLGSLDDIDGGDDELLALAFRRQLGFEHVYAPEKPWIARHLDHVSPLLASR